MPVNWYNYTLASAGTIGGDSNTVATTESICPKGWSLPSNTQIASQKNITIFSPVLGGDYYSGVLYRETLGFWWGSEVRNGANRYRLAYDGTNLYTDNGRRNTGIYIRCVQKST